MSAPGLANVEPSGSRFRPTGRRRNRIAIGAALVAVAIAVNVVLYASLDDRAPVVQAVRDIPAGEVITLDALRTVDADLDGTVNVIAGGDLDAIVGQYAKVRIVAGSLVPPEALQHGPLVADGSAVLAIEVADGSLPVGLRERSPIQLVLPGDPDGDTTTTIDGRVVGLPRTPDSALGTRSVTVEVAAEDASTVAAASTVRIVLVEPRPDPAAGDGS